MWLGSLKRIEAGENFGDGKQHTECRREGTLVEVPSMELHTHVFRDQATFFRVLEQDLSVWQVLPRLQQHFVISPRQNLLRSTVRRVRLSQR